LRVLAAALLGLAATALVFGAPADLARGLAWLQAQVQTDGSLPVGKTGSLQQARCEAATTLLKLAGTGPQVSSLLAGLQPQGSDEPTETLACWQQLRQQLGQNILDASLDARRVGQQGYAAYEGFGVANALDTGWALAARLQTLPAADKASVLAWLQSTQAASGAFLVAGKPDLVATAVLVRALKDEVARNATASAIATKAATWLIAQRSAQGDWVADVAVSSIVFEAVHPYSGTSPAIASEVEAWLLAQQQPDGSWQGDAYVTAVALRALALTGVPAVNPTRSGLKLKIVDARTAAPVPGVQLVSTSPAVSAQSDVSGAIQLTGLAPGTYQFNISTAGYAAVSLSATLPAGQILDLGTLQLIAPVNATTATISGTVREQGSNLGLAGATVIVEGSGQVATTGEDGSYLIAGVAPGALTLTASKAGYFAASGGSQAVAGQVLNFSPWLTRDSGAGAGCRIQGLVLDAQSQQPLAGVTVSTTGASTVSATTGADGRYAMPDLASGLTRITASKPGYDSVSASAQISCSATQPTVGDFSPRLYATDQSPPKANTAAIAGVVMDASTNAPIVQAQLMLTPATGATQAGQSAVDGSFRFEGLDAASVQLQVHAPGYQGVTLTYTITPLQDLDIGQVRLRAPKVEQLMADLKVLQVVRGTARTDAQTLQLAGQVQVTVANGGTQQAAADAVLTAFEDVNRNNRFDASIDAALGTATLAQSLPPAGTASVSITVQGVMAFRDAPVHVVVDPGAVVADANRDNNVGSTAQSALRAPGPGLFDPRLKWAWDGTGAPHPEFSRVMSAPAAGRLLDTNGDGIINAADMPVLCFAAYANRNYEGEGVIRCLRGDSGQLALSIRDPAVISGATSIALADLDGDGQPEIVAATVDKRVIAFRNTGQRMWLSQPTASRYAPEAAVTIADLEGNGSPNIIFMGSIFSASGTFLWRSSGGETGSSYASDRQYVSVPIAADLDGVGKQDVIFGAAVYRADGSLKWRRHDGYAAVADLDRDGRPEIVVVYDRSLYAYTADGTQLWRVGLSTAIGGGPPTIGDFDGDGVPEIGVSGTSSYAVFRADGSRLWQKSAFDASGITGSTVFDFDGDGRPEVLYADEQVFRVFDGATGIERISLPNGSGTIVEYPIVADLDADGQAEMVVVANDLFSSRSPNGIRVFAGSEWVGSRSVWNQHAYHIDNINDDLTVPRVPVQSWKTHNTFRLNKRVDGDPRAVPDLTVGYLRAADGGAAGSQLTVRVGNTGAYAVPATTRLAVYSSNPALGTPTASALVGTATVGAELQPGQWRDVSIGVSRDLAGLNALGQIWIVGDDDGLGQRSLQDFDRSNNTLQGDLPVVATHLVPGVSADKPVYTEADVAAFTASIRNGGSFPQAVAVRFTILDADDQAVETLPLTALVSVPAGGPATVAAPWPVAGILAGSYSLKAELLSPAGLVYGAATTTFAVTASQAQAAGARITADRVSYSAAQTVQLASRVSNTTRNTVLDDVQARTEVRSAGGQVVFSRTEAIAQIAPQGARDWRYSLAASGLASGSYGASLQLLNASGTVLAASTTSFSVLGAEHTGVGLTGQLQANPAAVLLGQGTQLLLQATNASASSLSGVPVTVQLVEPVAGSVVTSYTATIADWAAGSTQQLAFHWPVAIGADGQVLVAAATATVGGREVALAQTNIRLVGVPQLQGAPTQLTYAPIHVGENASQQVVVSSVGTTTATAVVLGLAGANASQFVIPSGGCTQQTSLAMGATCTFTVSYRPTEAGSHTAQVRVGYAGGEDVVIDLAGEARPVILTGTVAADPVEVALGQPTVLSYTVSNPSTATTSAQVTLSLRDAAGATLTTWPVAVDNLAGAATLAGSQSYTPTGVPQTLTVVLSQSVPPSGSVTATTSVLATTTLSVTPVPVKVSGTPQRRSEARVLVLASCPQSETALDLDDANPSTTEIEQGAAQPDIAGCAAQRGQAISAYLTQLGVAHKVVTTATQFQEEMRCGTWNTYWLSGGAAKLDRWLARELREAVWRGEGLVVDNEHDARNHLLHPVAGVKYRGKLPTENQQASIAAGSLFAPGPLVTLGQVARFELLTGQSQGLFTTVPGNQGPAPAIVANRYGAGHSMLFAFNLGAMLAADPQAADARLKEVVTASLARAGSNLATVTTGDAALFGVSLVNEGSRTGSARVVATLPAGIGYLGSNVEPSTVAGDSTSGGTVTWTVALPAGATRELTLRVRADNTGEFTIPVAVYSLFEGSGGGTQTRLNETVPLNLSVTAASGLVQAPAQAVNAVAAATSSDLAAKDKAARAVTAAQQAHAQGQYQQALVQWETAADALISIAGADTSAARTAVAWALEVTQDGLCQVMACLAGSLSVNPTTPLGSVLGVTGVASNSCQAQVAGTSLATLVTNSTSGQPVYSGQQALDLAPGQSRNAQFAWQPMQGQAQLGDWLETVLHVQWQGQSKLVATALTQVTNQATACHPGWSLPPERFTAFAGEGVTARGGRNGNSDWEWALGTPASLATADIGWQSGKTYGWTLTVNAAGQGTLTVSDGAAQIAQVNYASGSNKLRVGNALRLAVSAAGDVGSATISGAVTQINGQSATMTLATTAAGQDRQAIVYLPAQSQGLSASGTVRLDYAGNSPPQGTRLTMTVQSGQASCQ
jgi:hypothetical protein